MMNLTFIVQCDKQIFLKMTITQATEMSE